MQRFLEIQCQLLENLLSPSAQRTGQLRLVPAPTRSRWKPRGLRRPEYLAVRLYWRELAHDTYSQSVALAALSSHSQCNERNSIRDRREQYVR